jgi:hypothetical protein
MNAATQQPQKCLSGLCPNKPVWMVAASVGGRRKELAVCEDCLLDIHHTVYVRPIDEVH